jgi:hypothetical protein
MPPIDERALIEKLMRIEALHAGATTPGERAAAESALERIRARLAQTVKADPPIEYRFTLADGWGRKVFLALLRRYDLKPYRYPRQRHTTVMVRVPRRFVDETLWPQYIALAETLQSYLNEVTERVISEALHKDQSEAAEAPEQIGLFGPEAR